MCLFVAPFKSLDVLSRSNLVAAMLLVSFYVLVYASTAMALDEQRLWLPSNYERLYLDLKKSAMTAEKLERCSSVLRGTIDFDASTSGNPIFRILCRQPDGRTYNEMVDGNSGKTLTTELVLPELLSNAEKEHLAEESEKRRTDAIYSAQEMMWQLCDMELADQTKLFKNLNRLRTFSPPLDFNFEYITEEFVVVSPEGVFKMDFDAVDMEGVKLEYRAKCYVENSVITKIKIRKRQEVKPKSMDKPIDLS